MAIDLSYVRFKVYHGGFNAHPGECMWVEAEWAKRAIASGIVEAATPPDEPKSEAKG